MSIYIIIECDACSSARRGDCYSSLWKQMKADGWESDNSRGLHFCPVCVALRKKREKGDEHGNKSQTLPGLRRN